MATMIKNNAIEIEIRIVVVINISPLISNSNNKYNDKFLRVYIISEKQTNINNDFYSRIMVESPKLNVIGLLRER